MADKYFNSDYKMMNIPVILAQSLSMSGWVTPVTGGPPWRDPVTPPVVLFRREL